MPGQDKHKDTAGETREPGVPETAHAAEAESEGGGGAQVDPAAALAAERDELRDRWLRAEAELANYRRRAAREREEAERRAQERVLGGLLSLADDLERALDAAEQAEATGPIREGVRLVHDRVREILRSHGVEVVDPLGKPFDPHEAEAVLIAEVPGGVPGTVTAVVEKGYRMGDRLLRPAKVTVAGAPAREEGRESGGPPAPAAP